MRTVGFFGGSFDPVHFGHIALAVELMERYPLDEVLFCPAFCSPFKKKSPPFASPRHRLAMLQAALDLPQFKISTLELDRKECSYTIDTLRSLCEEEVQWRLLLSEETASQLDQWKEAKEVKRLAPPLVAPKRMGISSTEIRARLKKKLYCGHLVPAKTLDYIHKQNLYSS